MGFLVIHVVIIKGEGTQHTFMWNYVTVELSLSRQDRI